MYPFPYPNGDWIGFKKSNLGTRIACDSRNPFYT